MPRAIPSSMITALAGGSVELFYAVEMMYDSDPLRLWTGYGEKTINGDGQTYIGGGKLLSISEINDTAELSAQGTNIQLSGLDASIISIAMQEPYQTRPIRIYFGVGNDAIEVFGGLMDVLTILNDAITVTINLTNENRLVTLQRNNVRRGTDANQKSRHSNDDYFSTVPGLSDRELLWGRK